MCGRFTQHLAPPTLERLVELFVSLPYPHDELDDLVESLAACSPNSYNIAPTQHAAVLHQATPSPQKTAPRPARAHFGLIPAWARERSVSAKMINARRETIWEKPAFRTPIGSQRAVLPINGFYEWQPLPPEPGRSRPPKQPWYVHRADERPMLLACVSDTWADPERGGEPVESFAIITTQANASLRDKHHRMPVILEPESLGVWLDAGSSPTQISALMAPAREGVLGMHRVSTRVNRGGSDDAGLIEPDSQSGPATLWG